MRSELLAVLRIRFDPELFGLIRSPVRTFDTGEVSYWAGSIHLI
jgi:hypothetical protein